MEAASPLCLKMCVELESEHKDAINAAITGIEDYVVGCIANTDQKRLMMHDFALVNTTRTVEDNAHSDGGIEAVYQREFLFQNHDHAAGPSLFKWMCVVPFPVQAGGGRDTERLVVGPKGAGIREMGGDAGCFVWVSRDNLSRGFVYVSGDSRQEVESCATRAKHRIQWAVRRFKEILKERLQKNSRSN